VGGLIYDEKDTIIQFRFLRQSKKAKKEAEENKQTKKANQSKCKF
jgi:hypothetical protein